MSDEQDDEWPDEDEDEAETWCIQCHRYCWPDELQWKICQECRDKSREEDEVCPDK